MVDVPESLLAERRRTGADGHDEMWEGVLHMVPPASGPHQRLGTDLVLALGPIATGRHLVAWYETGLFRPGVDDDYRVPDQIYARAELSTDRGVDGPAELVVEIRSSRDETYAKLDFYAALGVGEVLVIHPDTRTAELFVGREGQMVLVQPGPDGLLAEALGARIDTVETVDGPRLRLRWEDGSAEI